MKRLIIFIILCFFLAGCSHESIPQAETLPMVLTDSELVSAILDTEVGPKFGFIVPDMAYMLPSEKWFREEFPRILRGFQDDLKAAFYVAEENDCDNFAKLGVGFAQVLHHNTFRGKVRGTSIAIGEFHYYSEVLKTGHAIIVALVRDENNKPKLLFLEPQKCEIITLTEYEKTTCRNYIF